MEKIATIIKKVIQDEFDLEIEPIVSVPDKQFGDYSTNVAMQIASSVGDNPRVIAEKIAEKLDYETSIMGPGFINISLSSEAITAEMNKFLAQPETHAASEQYRDKVVVTEFSDPNPFKVLHMGHFYTSVVGDAISNLVEAAGGKVHRVNFGGDVGLHAAKTIWAVIREIGGENYTKLAEVSLDDRADWLSKRYIEGNQAYENNEQSKAEIVEVNKKLYKIIEDDDHESALALIYWETRQWSYDYFDAFYEKVGIKFDKYYPESTGAGVGLDAVLSHPEVYTKSNGAIVFDGEKYGLHTRVFVNSEGLPTYETKDLGCDLLKYKDYHFDKQIIITGNEIVEYMKVVLKSLEQFEPKIALATEHMTHGQVKLPGGVKQSSRLGNFVKATDVLDMVAEAQEKEQGNRNNDTILGAIKYAFLKNRLGPDVIFDPATSVSLAGNSGPYLQYSLARAKSILRKLSDDMAMQMPAEQDFDSFERDLAMKLMGYGEMAAEATATLAPHLVCTYLYELAQTFNRFYENCKVEGDSRQALRTQLVYLYSVILSRGLQLLGIPLVEKM